MHKSPANIFLLFYALLRMPPWKIAYFSGIMSVFTGLWEFFENAFPDSDKPDFERGVLVEEFWIVLCQKVWSSATLKKKSSINSQKALDSNDRTKGLKT